MKNTNLIFGFWALVVAFVYNSCGPSIPPLPLMGTCEGFNGMPLAQYGTNVSGIVVNPPGSTIFSIYGGVPVRIQNLNAPSGPWSGFVAIENASASFGAGKVVRTNGACIELIFSGKNVKEVTYNFRDTGGTENVWVNSVHYIGDLTAIPPTLGNATFTVTPLPPTLGVKSKMAIKVTSGTIDTLRIGGSEFHLDDLCYQ